MYSVQESKEIWNDNAAFWDDAMGDESNEFHRETVRPKVSELLNPQRDDFILDIACGNGNYSAYLAQRDIAVTVVISVPEVQRRSLYLCKHRRSPCRLHLSVSWILAKPGKK